MDLNDEPTLSVECSDVAGAPPVVSVSGELDLSSAPILRDALEPVIALGPDQVIIDLSDLRFVDSTGLAVLLEAQARVDLRLRDSSLAVQRIIEATGLAGTLRSET